MTTPNHIDPYAGRDDDSDDYDRPGRLRGDDGGERRGDSGPAEWDAAFPPVEMPF